MALARLFPTIGGLIIRKLGDVGGPPSDRVSQELDNLIAWVKASPRNIRRDFSVVNSSGVGPDVLHTFSLDTPNRLLVDGDYLDVWYGGNFAVNDRDKIVQAQFDNQNYCAAGAVDLDAASGWAIASRIMRTDSTHVITSSFLIANTMAIDSANAANSFTEGGIALARNATLTVANLNSNAITMRVRSVVGAGAAAAHVFQNLSIINLTLQ